MAIESQSSNIILFPKYEELKSEVEELRADLSKLYFEYDELRFVICPNIEMQYMLALGAIEYKLFEAQCKMLRLKRKIELIQAKLNRQETIVISEIEAQLDEEFAEYQDLLEIQIEAMNEALDRSKGKILSTEDEEELKALYRKIVKALHPDLNSDLSRAEMDLFMSAVEAYKNADLNVLRIIAEMMDDGELPDESDNALAYLAKERDRLQALIEHIKEEICITKECFPYNRRDIVKDSAKIEEMKQACKRLQKLYEEEIELYKAKIAEMLE